MERGQFAGDTYSFGGLLPADRAVGPADEPIHPPSQLIAQRRHGRQRGCGRQVIEPGVGGGCGVHEPTLTAALLIENSRTALFTASIDRDAG